MRFSCAPSVRASRRPGLERRSPGRRSSETWVCDRCPPPTASRSDRFVCGFSVDPKLGEPPGLPPSRRTPTPRCSLRRAVTATASSRPSLGVALYLECLFPRDSDEEPGRTSAPSDAPGENCSAAGAGGVAPGSKELWCDENEVDGRRVRRCRGREGGSRGGA